MSSDYYGSIAGDIADARRAPGMTADCDGNPLGAGDRVAAWRIGVQYTAVVKKIGDYGDGRNENFRRLTLVRDDDGAEVEGFSNLVMVIRPAGATRGRHFPGGHYTDLTYGNGGPARHQCGGCGSPIQPRYDAWLHALTRSSACPGNTTDADFWAKAAGTPDTGDGAVAPLNIGGVEIPVTVDDRQPPGIVSVIAPGEEATQVRSFALAPEEPAPKPNVET